MLVLHIWINLYAKISFFHCIFQWRVQSWAWNELFLVCKTSINLHPSCLQMCFFFCFCYVCFNRCRKKTKSRELWRRSPGRARKKKNHNRIFTTCLSTQQQQKYFGTGMQNQQRRAYIYKIILGRRRRHKSLTCSSRRSKTSSRNISSAQTRRQIVGGKADYRLSK